MTQSSDWTDKVSGRGSPAGQFHHDRSGTKSRLLTAAADPSPVPRASPVRTCVWQRPFCRTHGDPLPAFYSRLSLARGGRFIARLRRQGCVYIAYTSEDRPRANARVGHSPILHGHWEDGP
eukprot:357586-Chlamydomonas_euryale.AAC.10